VKTNPGRSERSLKGADEKSVVNFFAQCFLSVTMNHQQKGSGGHYRDFVATVEERDLQATSSMKKSNFPEKLHYVLSDMEKDGLQHVASWQPHGRCFVVHDKQLFVEKVLPL
jgi:hypothetical protein